MNTPDLYAAWLAAGNRLQPIVGWIVGHWWLLPTLAAVAFAAWSIRRSLRDASRRVDDILTDRAEPAEPGRDVRLYLDCVAIYDDCDELDRLRAVVDQHRKENPQP